jgi:CheY-like chemotaxis protein
MNLVVNASEAFGNDKGEIVIRTGTMWCDKEYLEQTYLEDDLVADDYSFFEVTDTGRGMNEVIVSKIFDPFFSTKFTGRGLGLAAVMGIVRGHRGAIKVYSEPGKGTSFKVLFPASPGSVRSREESGLPENLEKLEGKTVLLVDDEEVVRNVGRTMLERLNMTVITAEDGERALALYKDKHEQIDFVILDLTMPRMDGEETFHEIRRLDRDVCVLLSSGYSQQELSSRFATQPLAGFIQKPYQIRTLGASLLQVLEEA